MKHIIQYLKQQLVAKYGLEQQWFHIHPSTSSNGIQTIAISIKKDWYNDFCRLEFSNLKDTTECDRALEIVISQLGDEITSYKEKYRQKGRKVEINHPVIEKLFTYEITDKSGKNVIAKVKNKLTGDVYFSCYRVANGKEWKIQDSESPVFSKIRGKDKNVTEISYTSSKGYGDIKVNYVTGQVTIPSMHTDKKLCGYIIKKSTPLELVLDQYKVCVGCRGCKKGEASKSMHRYFIYLKNNKVESVRIEIPVPSWIEQIKTKNDLLKNPLNVDAHEYLYNDTPKLKGKHVYITSGKDVYVRLEQCWLLTSMEWFEAHGNQFPEASQEFSRYKVMQHLVNGGPI